MRVGRALSVVFLFVMLGQFGVSRADSYDNLTPQEHPRKKPPLTKYEKSEYLSVTHETGKPYIYRDGEPVGKSVKARRHRRKGKSAKSTAAESSDLKDQTALPPKKKLKPVSFENPDKHKRGGGSSQSLPPMGTEGTNPELSGGQPPGEQGPGSKIIP